MAGWFAGTVCGCHDAASTDRKLAKKIAPLMLRNVKEVTWRLLTLLWQRARFALGHFNFVKPRAAIQRFRVKSDVSPSEKRTTRAKSHRAIFPILVAAVLPLLMVMTVVRGEEPFRYRGYYLLFTRAPTFGLEAWKETLDCIHEDGGNVVLLWMGGAFRSKKFPITWHYNEAHANVQHDFVRELIDHAHRRQIKVLLAFTPFAYDGVNQYPLEHPELRARQRNGQPAEPGGIGCLGPNLCPAQEESQNFMRDYVREMFFEFYPNADGLMIEASDYAICFGSECGDHYFDHEFRFVSEISREIWKEKPEAIIVTYPHYFSGAKVPGFGVNAARQPFDSRWTLFFTPHSAHPEPDLIRQAHDSFWWDDSPVFHGPEAIRAAAQHAREIGASGYVPTLECYSYTPAHAEEGQQWIVGRPIAPFGFGWLKAGQCPYRELPLRVNRIAYRAFSKNPDLSFAEFRTLLGRELFSEAATPALIDDALELQHAFAHDRTWCQAAPLAEPERVRAWRKTGQFDEKRRAELQSAIERMRSISERHRDTNNVGAAELGRIAAWVVSLWSGENAGLLRE